MTTPISGKLKQYSQGHNHMLQVLSGIPTEVLQWRPSPDKWTIHEIVIHIVDSEAHSFIRCRSAIAESGKAVVPYDQEKWTPSLHYDQQDVNENLNLLKYLRSTTYRLLSSLSDSEWSRTYLHPEHGEMNLEDWLDSYNGHLTGHMNQIKRNYEAWKAR
jgi:hypothetical protein